MGVELEDWDWEWALMGKDGKTAHDRFVEAFAAELAEHPNKPPGPAALIRRMGWHSSNLSGIYANLRRGLLTEAGFYKEDIGGRWLKAPDPDDVEEVEEWLTT